MDTRNKIAFISAARTANEDSAELNNSKWKGAQIIIDATVEVATASVVFTVRGKDDVSGKFYDLISSSAITAIGTTVLTIYPGVIEAGNKISDCLPETFLIHAEHADADALTYSVGVNMLH